MKKKSQLKRKNSDACLTSEKLAKELKAETDLFINGQKKAVLGNKKVTTVQVDGISRKEIKQMIKK